MQHGIGTWESKRHLQYPRNQLARNTFFFFFFFFFTSPDENNFFFFPLLSPSSWPLFMMNGSHAASLLSGGRVSCSCSTSCSSSNGHNLSLCSTVARRQRHLRHLGHGGSFSGGHFLKKGVPWVQHVLTHPHMGRASRPEEHAKAKHVSVRLQIPNEDRQVVAQDEAARMVVVGNTEYVHTHTHTRLLCFALG